MIKQRLLLCAGLSSVLAFGACKKDKKPYTPPAKKNVKFTITVTGSKVLDGDHILIQTYGGTAGSTERTIWKVDGTVRTNELGIMLDEDDFEGNKTYVIESVVPLDLVQLSISTVNSGTPFTLKITGEIAGKAIDAINQAVTTDYARQFTY